MEKLTVMVCPMDWGLGHASRCVPVIMAFIREGCRVIVAVSGAGAGLIKSECNSESLTIVPFPGFTVSYARSFLFARLVMQVPAFVLHVYKERKLLKGLVEKFRPGLIVSDNRYGLLHDEVPSILITHQLKPSLPYYLKAFEYILAAVIRNRMSSFYECWIPDYHDFPAAGDLTMGHDKLPAAYFTGWLSRFDAMAGLNVKDNFRYRIMFLLSGPEPQRSLFEDKIIEDLKKGDVPALVVRGLPGEPVRGKIRSGVEIVSFMDSGELMDALLESEVVVCRSGYSSVMDMLTLGKPAVLVPTPGQTEQEYLGRWLSDRGWFRVIEQKNFDIDLILNKELSPDNGNRLPSQRRERDLLEERVRSVLKRISSG